MTRRVALGTGALIPGTPYRLRRWLGDGGMGAVFEAEHVDIERRVAVKLLHAQSVSQQWVVDGFRNEARVSARIGAPNIVDIYDFKELDDGRLLIAMEFLDGPTLSDTFGGGDPPWPRLIAIARQICQGLAAAHAAGIVHRDIKPENIMLVERDGREDFVKLLDFGVAHFTCDGAAPRAAGTAHYMAPESVMGAGDARVDIYAVGCVLYELVTGEPPFDGSCTTSVLVRQFEDTPAAPSTRAAARPIPPGFDAIVLRCLSKDPNDRFQTMAQLEAALCELQIEQGWPTAWDDLPVPEVEEPRRQQIEAGLRALHRRRRHRAWIPRLLAGLLAVSTVAVVAAWPSTPVVDPAQDQLDEHVLAARAAASRFYFVYPPPGEPQGSTAYREILALEALGLEPAHAQGERLRQEFAQTLVRLGDRYWDFAEARRFAYEYYALALVFAEHPRARERAGVTPTMLEALRHRASVGEFTEHELIASEPLVALAQPDLDTRLTQLESLEHQPLAPSVVTSIDQVIRHERRGGRAQAASAQAPETLDDTAAVPQSDADTHAELEPAPLETIGAEDGADTTGGAEDAPPEAGDPASSDVLPRPQRDDDSAKALVRLAKAAKHRGDHGESETLLHKALAANPRSRGALDGLAALAYADAEYAKSVAYLERAIAIGSRSASRWLALGDSYYKELRYADAQAAYTRAQELGNPKAEARLTMLDRKLGRASD